MSDSINRVKLVQSIGDDLNKWTAREIVSEQNYISTRAANATIAELRDDLTAAQQRVAELEREGQEEQAVCEKRVAGLLQQNREFAADNARLRERIAELEAQVNAPCAHDRVKEWLDNDQAP